MRTSTSKPTTDEIPPDTSGSPADEAEVSSPTGLLSGLRARILFWSIGTLALAIVAAIVVVRQASLVQLDRRIDDALAQEVEELEGLSNGRDPLTGDRFNEDTRRIFEVFLDRNVPARNETYLTFVDGELFRRTKFSPPPYRLDEDPELVARWARLERPEGGSIETPAGAVEYVAVPLRTGPEEVRGVFVAAIFRDLEADQVNSAVAGAIEVGVITLLIGSLIAWRIAEGVLRPVRAVSDAARRISSADLSQRLPVTGRDEVSGLAETFNEMLDKLQEAFDTQRRFVDDAGHELRTPITVIRGHLELMEDDPHERRATLALVEDELDRMHRIVNDLLTLAKAEQTDFLRFEPIDLAAWTLEVQAKAEALGTREWSVAGVGRGVVIGDRQRLTQAAIQLAQNAIQHTKEGDAIEIGSRLLGSQAEIWVRDSGEGIEAGDLERIFHRFARGAHPRMSDGAGLGLSIVRAIAEAHHGRVDVSSRRGEGSRFSLVIPADQPLGSPGGSA